MFRTQQLYNHIFIRLLLSDFTKNNITMVRTVISAFLAIILFSCSTQSTETGISDFNLGWKFSLDAQENAASPSLNDSEWRMVDLPHDWSVEFPFDTITGEGCTGYLPGGRSRFLCRSTRR